MKMSGGLKKNFAFRLLTFELQQHFRLLCSNVVAFQLSSIHFEHLDQFSYESNCQQSPYGLSS